MEVNVILEHIFKDDFSGTKFRILGGMHPSPGLAYSVSDETPSVSGHCRVRRLWYFWGKLSRMRDERKLHSTLIFKMIFQGQKFRIL
jgi:hypothetical protein